MSEKYQVSSSPHVRAKDSTSRVMLYVIIALLPATLFGIWNFGTCRENLDFALSKSEFGTDETLTVKADTEHTSTVSTAL